MSASEKHLSGKVAWITGSSRGIGRNIIGHLAKAGADVVLHGTNPDSPKTFDEGGTLQSVAEGIEKTYNVACLPVHGDLTQEKIVQEMVGKIHEKFKKIDILVHCAGGDIGTKGVQAELAGKPEKNDAVFVSYEDIQIVLNRNLMTCILCCRAVAPEMMERKSGKIVTIGSIAGLKGIEKSTIYATAKAALHHYTRCLAVQMKPYNVNVNAVAPGDIVTERWKASREYEQDKMVTGGTIDRYGQPEEISSVVEFMVSEQSTYVSGQILRVDGCVQPWAG